jgi:5'-methylthioadenosine phosphorylase
VRRAASDNQANSSRSFALIRMQKRIRSAYDSPHAERNSMLAIIGGTGVYQIESLTVVDEVKCTTPFGDPSSAIVRSRLESQHILFLARHGTQHQYLPHEINYRANIFALTSLGATQGIGISAIGSLREEIAPGDLAIPDQYFD